MPDSDEIGLLHVTGGRLVPRLEVVVDGRLNKVSLEGVCGV